MSESDDRLGTDLRALAASGTRAAIGLPVAAVRAKGARRRQRRVVAVAALTTLAVVGIGSVALGTSWDTAGQDVPPAGQDTTAPSPGDDLTGADLPTAEELPGFNEDTGWRTVSTAPGDGQAPASLCQRETMAGLGATTVWQRDFTVTPGPAAGTEPDPDAGVPGTTTVLAAEFGGDQEARQAAETLRSWVTTCDPAAYDDTSVNRLGAVSAPTGQGAVWLLSHRPVQGDPDASLLDGTAVGVSGDRVVLIAQTLIGQDYNYAIGETPIGGALAAALDRLPPG